MKKVYLGIIMAAFLFATMAVSLKITGNNMDPFQMTALRFLIGGILILPFAVKELKDNNIKITINDYIYLGVVGIVCIPISMLLFQLGVLRSNASTAAVLICMNPLFTVIFSRVIDKEKIPKEKIISLVVGLFGALMMIKPWDLQEGNTILGSIMLLLAAVTFGLYTVLGKRATKKVGLFAQTSISFIEGALVLIVIILMVGRPVVTGVVENWVGLMYVSIFVTGLGYVFYFLAIKYSDAATGAITFFIKPAIAPIIAVLVLDETIEWNSFIGIALVLLASFINLKGNKRADDKLKSNQG